MISIPRFHRHYLPSSLYEPPILPPTFSSFYYHPVPSFCPSHYLHCSPFWFPVPTGPHRLPTCWPLNLLPNLPQVEGSPDRHGSACLWTTGQFCLDSPCPSPRSLPPQDHLPCLPTGCAWDLYLLTCCTPTPAHALQQQPATACRTCAAFTIVVGTTHTTTQTPPLFGEEEGRRKGRGTPRPCPPLQPCAFSPTTRSQTCSAQVPGTLDSSLAFPMVLPAYYVPHPQPCTTCGL